MQATQLRMECLFAPTPALAGGSTLIALAQLPLNSAAASCRPEDGQRARRACCRR